MFKRDISILSTRPVGEALILEARKNAILIDEATFIETIPVKQKEVIEQIQTISRQLSFVIFTSMNAVEAVAGVAEKPDWKIYCIGHATQRLVRENFGEFSIAGTADDASALADRIIADEMVQEIVFFCGNQRREELPEKLKYAGRKVQEIVVYNTIETSDEIQKYYDGILYFSPSAVRSFFECNVIVGSTILFAIGSTTAEELRKHSSNEIVIAEKPGKENLVKQAISFYQTRKRSDANKK